MSYESSVDFEDSLNKELYWNTHPRKIPKREDTTHVRPYYKDKPVKMNGCMKFPLMTYTNGYEITKDGCLQITADFLYDKIKSNQTNPNNS